VRKKAASGLRKFVETVRSEPGVGEEQKYGKHERDCTTANNERREIRRNAGMLS